MELQADQAFLVDLIRRARQATDAFDYDTVWQDAVKMLKRNTLHLVPSAGLSDLDRDMLRLALLQGRGNAGLTVQLAWDLPSIDDRPLLSIFTSDAVGEERVRNVVGLDGLEAARPSLVPPISTIDWHVSSFSESAARAELRRFASPGPFLIVSDNYLFSASYHERTDGVAKDLARSMMLFVDGMTARIQDLGQILFLGAMPVKEPEQYDMEDLVDALYDELEPQLLRKGFRGELFMGLTGKGRKGTVNSKHDRHIFTGSGQLIVTDSLRLFKNHRPFLTESMTLLYRQYTEPSTHTAIAKHASVLRHQLHPDQLKFERGDLNRTLVENALRQLERDLQP